MVNRESHTRSQTFTQIEDYTRIENDIKALLKCYEPDIQDFLFNKNLKSVDGMSLDVIESIKSVLKNALQNVPEDKYYIKRFGLNELKSADTLFFGDVHAQLDLFLQNLYVAGVIDKNGSIRDEFNKTAIQLGDTINKGIFEWETLVYMRVLKKQAHKKGLDFHYLIGNHEIEQLTKQPQNMSNYLMSKMIKSDILDKTLEISFGSLQKNLFCCHSSMEKEALIRILCEMSNDIRFIKTLGTKNKQLELIKSLFYKEHNHEEMQLSLEEIKEIKVKTSSKYIYSTVFSANITFKDISNWLNEKFREQVKLERLNKNTPYAWLFLDAHSVVKSKKKALNAKHPERAINPIQFLIRSDEDKYKYKPVQVVGHKQTITGVKEAFGVRGGIMQNKATIFADTGMVAFYGGHQGFVIMDSNTGISHAIELRSTNSCKSATSELNEKNEQVSLSKKTEEWQVRKLEAIRLYDIKEIKEEMKKHAKNDIEMNFEK